ncbi:MAG: hypothetical protein QX191_00405 [Methylococcaceae bacterium]
MSDFVPTSDNDLLVWFDHFLMLISADKEIAVADLAALTAAKADFHIKIDHLNETAARAKQATADKNASRNNLVNLIRAEARRIKARASYSEGQGAHFGIIGRKDSHDLSSSRPELSGIDHTDGVVTLTFSKYNSDGVNIYTKRGDDADWVLLVRATISPFIDVRPLLERGKPELRHYCVTYVLKDKEIGLYSNEIVINCTP